MLCEIDAGQLREVSVYVTYKFKSGMSRSKITDSVTTCNDFSISAQQTLAHLSTFKCLFFCEASYDLPEGITHSLYLYFLL